MDWSWLSGFFPNAGPSNAEWASHPTPSYNCIAFAAGKTNKPWWPAEDDLGGYFWPPGLPREPYLQETIQNFINAFATEGYAVCADGSLEAGIEKIVVYQDETDRPTHAARQLPDGRWVSKLGDNYDIKHSEPSVLHSGLYGVSTVFMSRRIEHAQDKTG
jgi:hypothetical protein